MLNLLRLYVADINLTGHLTLHLSQQHTHYLYNVMRSCVDDNILIFNENSGEWIAKIIAISKKTAIITIMQQTIPLSSTHEVMAPYLINVTFAPSKAMMSSQTIQAMTALGVNIIQPMITQHTVSRHPSVEKMQANAIEAVEQCGRISPPKILKCKHIRDIFAEIKIGTYNNVGQNFILFCTTQKNDSVLSVDRLYDYIDKTLEIKHQHDVCFTLFIGPEGGFSDEEELEMCELCNISNADNNNTPTYISKLNLGNITLRAEVAIQCAITTLITILSKTHKSYNLM